VHTGEAELREGDYYGPATNRAARIMAVGHGGQILVSAVTVGLVREQLAQDTTLKDLGEHRLKGLTTPEHLWQIMAPGLRAEFPALPSLTTLPNNLPLQLTSFVGREKELKELRALLKSARLVTLTGSGGTGKTRLVLEAGAGALPGFRHGVWLVELASLADAAQIMPAVAQTFGLNELPTATLKSQVTDYLRDKSSLLLLDNCEHLIDACARLADDLLHQCAGLKILASSREALGIAGEIAYRTPSLAQAESVQLFVERACAANPRFNLTEDNAPYIAQICARLDGIPLAIELAAARAKWLSPEQITTRLDDRFRLLVGGSRTALPRQQTLRALIDWSYDLLSEDEQRLLRTASVFVGGWTLDAIEAVGGAAGVLERLEQLVNKSLVVADDCGTEMRYILLETIRQYAREKLLDAHEAPQVRDRHFDYFNDLSETMWEGFRSSDILPVRDRAEAEADNFRAALEWGLGNHAEQAVRLAANYCIFSSLMGLHAEGLAFANAAVERARALRPAEGEGELRRQKLIARALFSQGMVGLGVGNVHLAIRATQEAIALSRATGDRLMLGYSLEMYYTATRFMSAPDADEAVQEGLVIFSREIDDRFGRGIAYLNMARAAASRGDDAEKSMYFARVKEIIREQPGTFQVGMFFLGMGLDEAARGNYETARKILEEGRDAFKRFRDVQFQMVMTSELGHIERHTGNLAQARLIYRETIAGWQKLGNRSALAHELECFGFLALAAGDPQRAARLFGSAEALREKIATPMTDWERAEYNQSMTQLRSSLDEKALNLLWAEGRDMTMEQAVQFALQESS